MRNRLVLASQSPRRAELLGQIGLPFDVYVTDVDETRLDNEPSEDYVRRLAQEKCLAGWQLSKADRPAAVIGADTIVLLGDEILGKPRGLNEGKAMLAKLAGNTHTVLSGVAVSNGQCLESTVVASAVTFTALSQHDIDAYSATGEGGDKAGSYGIQGIGGIFVERIEGSFSAVMGLPVQETEALLRTLNIDTWSMRSHG
ncbi:MAG: septum formation inhibitor Maf [Pseudomonadales bacterium]|nr:septum formation inhibitor Maf [Pseudomonadales bacterium]